MAEYAISSNLLGWAPILQDKFGWPLDSPEGELVRRLEPGDVLIPKFAQNPEYVGAGGQRDYQRAVCEALALDYGDALESYNETVAGGNGAVPFILHVTRQLGADDTMPSGPWAMVAVERDDLRHPLTTQEFLKLRATPLTLARQFKAMAAPGRHVQKVQGMAREIRAIGELPPGERVGAMRRFSLVKAYDAAEARARLADAGVPPTRGDRAVLVNEGGIPGVHRATDNGDLEPDGEAINIAPRELLDLFHEAKERGNRSFRPANPLAAAAELASFMADSEDVRDIEQFGYYHDLYVRLPRNVNQALRVVRSPRPPTVGYAFDSGPENGDDPGVEELQNLLGLTADGVRNGLPAGFAIQDSVLDDAVTALRSGKHLLLSGPPGTGKTTVAMAICSAVVDEEFDVTTATADWTTFQTIGGYLPEPDGQLHFVPGVVLRALERSHWLVVDELNRADIDKAFGPLFTLLSSVDAPPRPVVLPYRGRDGVPIDVGWSESATSNGAGPYAVTPSWRLIGTLNLSDKAALFQLSFAFLRRFAVIEIPLPPRADYAALFRADIADVDGDAQESLVKAAMALAFGERELGPAILRDIATFVSTGTTPTPAGPPPFADPVDAFRTAVRLYAVPQYEGATRGEIDALVASLENVWPDHDWTPVAAALETVALA